jgi:molybdopterin-synthase adenylyltransferase
LRGRLGARLRDSAQERQHDDNAQPIARAHFKASIFLRRSVAQRRCLSRELWGYDERRSKVKNEQRPGCVNDPLNEKYSRQILFSGIGREGQERLLTASAVIAGCGAIGAAAAGLLVRAGVGRVRVIDRDFVEPSNLQRQTLFDEAAVNVYGVVADINPRNARELLSGFDVILDGTDNFETRFLLNDFAIQSKTPWIYAAAVASYGLTLTVLPGQTACLACVLESNRARQGLEETCDTVGVLGPIVNLIASLEVAEALKLLAGHNEKLHHRLISCDVWSGRFQSVHVPRNPECRACAQQAFTYLNGDAQPHITMCGRDSVQIHERGRVLDLHVLSSRLAATVDQVRHNEFLLRFRIPPYEMTVFADGRAILKGTQDPAVARSLYARYIGA